MTRATIAIPVFNGQRFIRDAIDSALAQTVQDLEVLVVDDGSTDDTASILATIEDSRVRVLTQDRNQGVSAALNLAFAEAQGEFIGVLAADDLVAPTWLELSMNLLDANPDLIACGCYLEIFGALNLVATWPTGPEVVRNLFMFDCPITGGRVVYRTQSLRASGEEYRTDWRVTEDYELHTRLLRHGDMDLVPEVLYRWRIHGEQASFQYENGVIRRNPANAERHFLVQQALLTSALPVGFALPEDALRALLGAPAGAAPRLAEVTRLLAAVAHGLDEVGWLSGDAWRSEVESHWARVILACRPEPGVLVEFVKNRRSFTHVGWRGWARLGAKNLSFGLVSRQRSG